MTAHSKTTLNLNPTNSVYLLNLKQYRCIVIEQQDRPASRPHIIDLTYKTGGWEKIYRVYRFSQETLRTYKLPNI